MMTILRQVWLFPRTHPVLDAWLGIIVSGLGIGLVGVVWIWLWTALSAPFSDTFSLIMLCLCLFVSVMGLALISLLMAAAFILTIVRLVFVNRKQNENSSPC